jgi:hypothetical protein
LIAESGLGAGKIGQDAIEDAGPTLFGTKNSLDVLHHEYGGSELLDDSKIFGVKKMALVVVELDGVFPPHARPPRQRVGLARRSADQNPVLVSAQSFLDPAVDGGMWCLAKLLALGFLFGVRRRVLDLGIL